VFSVSSVAVLSSLLGLGQGSANGDQELPHVLVDVVVDRPALAVLVEPLARLVEEPLGVP
jgi:hypothetical protein